MADLKDGIRQALEERNFWSLATLNPDGSPQSTVVWVNVRDGKVLVNTALGRKKPRNIENDPRVALSWHAEGGYPSASIQGEVVETITGEQAETDIDDLAEKYLGERPYPWRKPGEQRVTYVIEPTHQLLGP
jgi:PPOX class probable F420-dependent enzyme